MDQAVIFLHTKCGDVAASWDQRFIYDISTTSDGSYITPIGEADKSLSMKEIEILNELKRNHPEIREWWIRNNILYLEIDAEI